MVDILSLMLYTKFGCHPPPPTTTGSLNKWLDEPIRGQVRIVKVGEVCRVIMGHLRVTLGSL